MLVNEVLRSGMLVQGEYVRKLEKEFEEYHKVKHAIAVSNGTATLHLSLKVLGIGPGDEVIVPAFSYVATANVVELVGATCIFVDIDERTFNIDVSKIESKITSRTKAIIPVHEFGLACDILTICSIASKYNICVIEDAACALGARQNDKLVGTFGDAAAAGTGRVDAAHRQDRPRAAELSRCPSPCGMPHAPTEASAPSRATRTRGMPGRTCSSSPTAWAGTPRATSRAR